MNKLFIILLFAAILATLGCDNKTTIQKGSYTLVEISAPSLKNNLVGTKAVRQIGVYLPPSYHNSKANYPVVYYLNGFTVSAGQYPPTDMLDKVYENKSAREVIFIELDGYNIFEGSMYANSPITGNWEDYITQDVIAFVDSHYRTLAKRESRGIVGHSMGGAGTFNISMKHADKYAVAYPMSPAIAYDGAMISDMFPNDERLDNLYEISKQMEGVSDADFAIALNKIIKDKKDIHWLLGIGAAFAYDATQPLRMKFPYYKGANGQYKVDKEIYEKWEYGLGGIAEKVKQYKSNLLGYKHYAIDCGYSDHIVWLGPATHAYDSILTINQIPHSMHWFDGNHVSKVGDQIMHQVLPIMATYLERE